MSYTGVDAQGNSTFCNHPEFVYIKRNLKDVNGKFFPMIVTVCSNCFDIAAIQSLSTTGKFNPAKIQAAFDKLQTNATALKQENAKLKGAQKLYFKQIKDLKDQLARCNNGVA